MAALLDRRSLLYRSCHPVSLYFDSVPVYTFRHISTGDGIKLALPAPVGSKLPSVLCCTHFIFLQAVLFPEEFGISTSRGLPNATRNSWIVGAVNAAPYIGSAAW